MSHTGYTAVLLWLFGASTCIGQQGATGEIKFLIDPGHNFEYVINHSQRAKERVLTIAPGDHHITVWAPTRRMVDTVLHVAADSLSLLYLRLPYATEYLQHTKEYTRYSNKKLLQRTAPKLITVGFFVWTLTRYLEWGKANQQLVDDEVAYDRAFSPGEVEELKNTIIPQHNEEFRKARNTFYMSAGISVGLVYLTHRLIKSSKKNHPPPVYEDQERLRFDGLTWQRDPLGGPDQYGISLTLR